MTQDLLLALVGFALVTSLTPGPNNLMLMASGVNFGVRRTMPHMLGVGIGFTVMIALMGLGLSQAFERFPVLHQILAVVAAIYMAWLAWKIAHPAPPGDGEASGNPMSFLQAAAFQWVNPKAWSMALTAIAAYAPGTGIGEVILVALVFGVVNLPSVSLWTVLGTQMRRLLRTPRVLDIFNWTMATLLLVSLIPVLLA
ncbi:MAG TPA: hypothetical protein DEO85_08200 [Maritimibacter sp.]|nr:hypothetical protein [Maritimibacter sp.]